MTWCEEGVSSGGSFFRDDGTKGSDGLYNEAGKAMAAVLQLLSSILSALLWITMYTALCLDILVVCSLF